MFIFFVVLSAAIAVFSIKVKKAWSGKHFVHTWETTNPLIWTIHACTLVATVVASIQCISLILWGMSSMVCLPTSLGVGASLTLGWMMCSPRIQKGKKPKTIVERRVKGPYSHSILTSLSFLLAMTTIVTPVYAQCSVGARLEHFEGESMNDIKSTTYPTTVQFAGNYLYDSFRASGSIIVPFASSNWKFKVSARRYKDCCLINQQNVVIHFEEAPGFVQQSGSLGGTGLCWGSTWRDYTTGAMTMGPSRRYPFWVEHRTGCDAYERGFVMYSSSDGGSTWEVVGSSGTSASFLQCTNHGCNNNLFGDSCDVYCLASTTCSGQGSCSYNGSCICDAGYTSAPDCSVYVPPPTCVAEVDCSGNGICNVYGTCDCNEGFMSEPDCSQADPVVCEWGASWLKYNDEVGFTGTSDSGVASSADFSWSDGWNGYDVSGSFVIYTTGDYEIEFLVSDHGDGVSTKVWFLGEEIIGGMAAGGHCLPDTDRTQVLTKTLFANKHYPFFSRTRTGCTIHSEKFRVRWRPVADPPADWILLSGSNLRHGCTYNNEVPTCDYGWYGSNCDRRCTIVCANGGECNEEGTACVCMYGFTGPSCTEITVLPNVPKGKTLPSSGETDDVECPLGWVGIRYNDEFFGSTSSVAAEWVTLEPSWSGDYEYKSVVLRGAVHAQYDGVYALRALIPKPGLVLQGEFLVDGARVGGSMGAAGACLGNSGEWQASGGLTWKYNTYHPIEVRLRTGCGLYDEDIQVEWQTPNQPGVWYPIPTAAMVQCQRGGCAEGYVGPDCNIACHPDVNCNGRGACREDGTCDCLRGVVGDTCDEFDSSSLVFGGTGVECDLGAVVLRYGDEVGFTNLLSSTIASVVDLDFRALYDAYVVRGSILVSTTGLYDLKIMVAAEGEVVFDGQRVSASLGPAGSCLPSIQDTVVLSNVTLYAHRHYAINVRMRTGCDLYPDYIRWMISDAGSDAWAPISDMNTYQCEMNECEAGWFGANCQGSCSGVDCSGHGGCFDGLSGDGSCVCDSGWVGDVCEYACDPAVDCSGNGECTQEGTCTCMEGFTGNDCSVTTGTLLAGLLAGAGVYAAAGIAGTSKMKHKRHLLAQHGTITATTLLAVAPLVPGIVVFMLLRVALLSLMGLAGMDRSSNSAQKYPSWVWSVLVGLPWAFLVLLLGRLMSSWLERVRSALQGERSAFFSFAANGKTPSLPSYPHEMELKQVQSSEYLRGAMTQGEHEPETLVAVEDESCIDLLEPEELKRTPSQLEIVGTLPQKIMMPVFSTEAGEAARRKLHVRQVSYIVAACILLLSVLLGFLPSQVLLTVLCVLGCVGVLVLCSFFVMVGQASLRTLGSVPTNDNLCLTAKGTRQRILVVGGLIALQALNVYALFHALLLRHHVALPWLTWLQVALLDLALMMAILAVHAWTLRVFHGSEQLDSVVTSEYDTVMQQAKAEEKKNKKKRSACSKCMRCICCFFFVLILMVAYVATFAMPSLPTWQVDDMSFGRIDLANLAIDLSLRINITNDNDGETQLNKGRIEVFFKEVKIGSVSIDTQTIAAKSVSPIDVNFNMRVEDLMPVAMDMVQGLLFDDGVLAFSATGFAEVVIEGLVGATMTVDCVQVVQCLTAPPQILDDGSYCNYGLG